MTVFSSLYTLLNNLSNYIITDKFSISPIMILLLLHDYFNLVKLSSRSTVSTIFGHSLSGSRLIYNIL